MSLIPRLGRARSRNRARAASPPDSSLDRVGGDGEAGAADVVLGEIGKGCLELGVPPDCSARRPEPAGPVCQTLSSQIQSKPGAAKPIDRCIGRISARSPDGPAHAQAAQPDAGVDLIERRDDVAPIGHDQSFTSFDLGDLVRDRPLRRKAPAARLLRPASSAPGALTGARSMLADDRRSSRSDGWRRGRRRCRHGSTRRTAGNRASADRSGISPCRRTPAAARPRPQEDAGQPVGDLLGDLEEVHHVARAGRTFDLESRPRSSR